ncbi:MAG TPA: tungsten formylmethanofuran dehydrogenase [Caldithrix abyssi]|uniref:Tungsten formylmethanofuran dehydrogenase n=1 Tax=Caldithrix abyssi TaxID=187145 RepID=A0A7V4U5I4_CALAY|nr:tungsten formylmethanofuran dehydrogenase [Caldithrix abyssi]
MPETAKKTKDMEIEGLNKQTLITLYKNMVITRMMDEKMLIMLKQGKSYFHIGAGGHEAIQTAAAFALQPGYDYAYPYYRDLGFVLQFGVTPLEVFLNFLGREADPSSGGRQMPNHYGHRAQHIVSQSSPTGTQYLQAVGTALGAVREGKDEVVYVSSGEGTTSQGDFHEALNWASRDKLPVIFVIQNNKYAISVPVKEQMSGQSVYKFTGGYEGLNRYRVDGTDFFASYVTVREAVEKVRTGNGPALIEADTVRLFAHSSSDSQKKYRTQEELEKDRQKDPIPQMEVRLRKKGMLDDNLVDEIKKECKEMVDAAAEEAEKYESPAPETLYHFLFAPEEEYGNLEFEKSEPTGNKIVLVDAINHTLKEEMERNDKMYIFGQDVADGKGGVFTATTGISTRFGRDRCFNAPLAESSIVGVAIGMAVRGLRPVIEIQFGDYIWTAMMQIRNEMATMRWRAYNNWAAPVVIRVPVGGYIHGGLCHSQNIEGFFAHLPGVKIAYPSNAADAKGLLKTAIRCPDPVLFLEHKGLYRQSYASAPEPDDEYLLPFGKAKVKRKGEDITVVTWGALVQKSLEAARQLEKEGLSVEVIDIRTIVPLDIETIVESLKKTGKILIAHEDTRFHGFGAEIAAQITEKGFEYLDGPVQRLAGADTPIPFSPVLEKEALPQTENIVEQLRKLGQY